MFEHFTERARKVMALANQEAQRLGDEYIGPEHILLGLVRETSGVAANVLQNFGVDLRAVRIEVDKVRKSGTEAGGVGGLPETPRTKRVIEYAIEESRNLNHSHVGTEHMLVGLLREEEGAAAQVLTGLNVCPEEVRAFVLNAIGAAEIPTEAYQAHEEVDDDLLSDSRLNHLQAMLAALREEKNEAVSKADYERAAKVLDEIEGLKEKVRTIRETRP